jgi:hypothetical protein
MDASFYGCKSIKSCKMYKFMAFEVLVPCRPIQPSLVLVDWFSE